MLILSRNRIAKIENLYILRHTLDIKGTPRQAFAIRLGQYNETNWWIPKKRKKCAECHFEWRVLLFQNLTYVTRFGFPIQRYQKIFGLFFSLIKRKQQCENFTPFSGNVHFLNQSQQDLKSTTFSRISAIFYLWSFFCGLIFWNVAVWDEENIQVSPRACPEIKLKSKKHPPDGPSSDTGNQPSSQISWQEK